MPAVNKILSKCIVEEEEDCLKSADELLTMVDPAIRGLRSPGQRLDASLPWLCHVCGKGHYSANPIYSDLTLDVHVAGRLNKWGLDLYVCDVCRHAELFLNNMSANRASNPF